MTSETENYNKLKTFFGKEYQALRAYVSSRIEASTDRDAEDIIQDVALKLFAGADRYSAINNVAGFVYRSIRNKIIDIMRSNKNTIKEDSNLAQLPVNAEMILEAPEDTFSEELKADLKRHIMSLKPDYRDIIIAIDFEGYTYKEMSRETGIPEGTLMSRRHRAISLLYTSLETKTEL